MNFVNVSGKSFNTIHRMDFEIFNEIKGRTQEADLAVPAKRGDYWYSTRTEEGRSYHLWVRMVGGPDGDETVLLDENAAAEGNAYFR